MPPTLTAKAMRQLLARKRTSTSRPTRNKNKIRPRFATKARFGIADVGKMAFVNPGILPNTEGPSRIPPITSAITRGCLSNDSGKCNRRHKIKIIAAYKRLNDKGFATGE
jgi:hypothetical protein